MALPRVLQAASCVALAAFSAGCGTEALERRAHQAHVSAAMHQQRATALEAQAAQLRAIVLVQQVLLVTMAQPAPASAAVAATPPAALPAAHPAALPAAHSAALPAAHPAAHPEGHPAAGPKPLLDEAGAPLATTSFGPVGEIVARAEAYLGRPLSGPERTALGQVLRRPRTMDPTSPWPVIQ